MKMKIILPCLFACLLFKFEVFAQLNRLNLDFEDVKNDLPTNWKPIKIENFQINTDSTLFKSGHRSVKITSFADEKYGGIVTKLHQNIEGETLTFSGFIKSEGNDINYIAPYISLTENVAYNSFDMTHLKNSGNWEQFSFSVELSPNKTSGIELGVFLKGKGKIWIDDLKITVDNSEDLKFIPLKIFLAEKDTIFNKSSGIDEIKITKINVEKIRQLGLIWGFTKYYHPNVGRGDFNFDYQLFRVLSKVLAADSKQASEQIILTWLKSLGEFETGVSEIQRYSVKYSPNFNWIKDDIISTELTQFLLKIKSAKRINEHYYFGFDANKKNPIFYHENTYDRMKYPDTGYRILSLFRYWNIINYFFPYKNLIDDPWENILQKYIPKLIQVKDKEAYFKSMLALIGEIKDSHATIWDADNTINRLLGERIIPIIISIENKPVVTGFYSKGNHLKESFQKGDIILKIDDKKVSDIYKVMSPLIPSSNSSSLARDVCRNLLRTNNQELTIELSRNNKKIVLNTKTIDFADVDVNEDPSESDSTFRLLDNNLAYIHNSTLKIKDLESVWGKMKNTKGLIIDNRNYPKTFHFWNFGDYLFSKETSFVKFTENSFAMPGLHSFKEYYKIGKDCDSCYKGKVVILVNEITQSSSEFQAMVYKSLPNSTIVGSTTAGADGSLATINLPGYIVSAISGIGVYFPDGRETQRIGILPDIFIRPTIKGIINNKDEVLDKAIEFLKN
jgi:C-terminal processing protease CtpA/Prc